MKLSVRRKHIKTHGMRAFSEGKTVNECPPDLLGDYTEWAKGWWSAYYEAQHQT